MGSYWMVVPNVSLPFLCTSFWQLAPVWCFGLQLAYVCLLLHMHAGIIPLMQLAFSLSLGPMACLMGVFCNFTRPSMLTKV